MIYIQDDRLTEREKAVREEMVNIFNPALKLCLDTANHDEFAKFQFNCCRQTAIMGAGTLSMLLPDYRLQVFTAEFDDEIMNSPVHYLHAFITAKGKEHRILIDLSRTTRPLLFTVITDDRMYPMTDGYEKISRIYDYKDIDWKYWLTRGLVEYLTGWTPAMLFASVQNAMQQIRVMKPDEQSKFVKNIYDKFTDIGGIFS